MLRDMKQSKITRVEVSNIFGYDKYVVAQGMTSLEDGTTMTFAEIFVFSQHGENMSIGHVDSYTVMKSE